MSTYVAVSALLIAYVALVAAYGALRTLARLRRSTALLQRGEDGRDSLLETITRQAQTGVELGEELQALRAYVEQSIQYGEASDRAHVDESATALRNVALVRYDAFNGTAGRMSFSLALLDDRGDGVAISALCGASDTRVYAKSVAAGRGEHELSPEETQAVQAAWTKKGFLAHRAS